MPFDLQDVVATLLAASALAAIVRHVFRTTPPAADPRCAGCALAQAQPMRWTGPQPLRYSRKA